MHLAAQYISSPAIAATAVLAVALVFRFMRTPHHLSLRRFESSAFLRRRRCLRRRFLRLSTGQHRHVFGMADEESPRGEADVEFRGQGGHMMALCCRWWGESAREPAELTPARREMLAELLASCLHKARPQELLRVVDGCLAGAEGRGARSEGALPRRRVGLHYLRAGRTGRALVVIVEPLGPGTDWRC